MSCAQLLNIDMSAGGKARSGTQLRPAGDAYLFVEYQRSTIVGATAANGARTARL